jgi:hypothetical protein
MVSITGSALLIASHLAAQSSDAVKGQLVASWVSRRSKILTDALSGEWDLVAENVNSESGESTVNEHYRTLVPQWRFTEVIKANAF